PSPSRGLAHGDLEDRLARRRALHRPRRQPNLGSKGRDLPFTEGVVRDEEATIAASRPPLVEAPLHPVEPNLQHPRAWLADSVDFDRVDPIADETEARPHDVEPPVEDHGQGVVALDLDRQLDP